MKRVIGAILIVVLGCILFGLVLNRQPKVAVNSQPKAIPADVLITQPGRYRSPNGQCEIKIWSELDGQFRYSFSDTKGNGKITSISFAPDSNWFMCWNSQGELWGYVAELDLKHCYCYYVRENGMGVRTAAELGGWDGVPETFKARLPIDVQEMCVAATAAKTPL